MSDAGDSIMRTLAESIAKRSARPVDEVLTEMREAQARGVIDPEPRKPERPTRAELAGRGVPEIRLRNLYDKEPKPCEAMIHVRRFIADRDARVMILMGNVGTCKSGSAAWALTQRAGFFVRLSAMVDGRLYSKGKNRDEESRKVWTSCRTVGLLVIDDVPTEGTTELGISTLDEIIGHRYDECLATLITVNATAPKAEDAVALFKSKYGPRVTDRANESGGVVVLAGKSVRGREW